jgi:hypothetical protein
MSAIDDQANNRSVPRNQEQPKSWRDVLPIHPAAELFPRMSESELRELGEDIKKNGMTSPIILWPGDNGKHSLLDGRNRLDAMELVGLKTVDKNGKLPEELASSSYSAVWTASAKQIKTYRRLDDPYHLVLSLNIHRRHLTAEQKRELIEKLLKAKPQSSDRTIAKQTKVDHKTVGKTRTKLEATGEIPQLKKTVGADGKSRLKPKKPAKPAPPAKIDPIGSPPVRYSESPATSVSPESRPQTVSAKDTALYDFSARAMDLVRITQNKSAERFVKTSVAIENIRHLAKFFDDLVVAKTAEVTKERQAQHAALNGAAAS